MDTRTRLIKKQLALNRKDTLLIKLKHAILFNMTDDTCAEIVEKYTKIATSKEEILSKSALKNLFTVMAHGNAYYERVLIKVAAINQLYNANLFYVSAMAEQIVKCPNLDNRLRAGDEGVVKDIALLCVNGKEYYCYSFATKYCHFENPSKYPIFDSYVEKAIIDFSKKGYICKYSKQSLRTYSVFKKAVAEISHTFKIYTDTYDELDSFMWHYGKTNFPNKY